RASPRRPPTVTTSGSCALSPGCGRPWYRQPVDEVARRHEAGARALEPLDEPPHARQGAREAHIMLGRPHAPGAGHTRLIRVEFPGVQVHEVRAHLGDRPG